MTVLESFKKDVLRQELLPVKILMFLIYGGQATLYPYFTVHLKSLGVSVEQTAVIFAVQPVIALLVAPVMGMCADRIGNFKYVFSFFLIFSAITSNLLLLVPEIPRRVLVFQTNCLVNPEVQDSKAETLLKRLSCDVLNTDPSFTFTNYTVQISSCTTIYNGKDNANGSAVFILKNAITYQHTNIQIGDTFDISFTIPYWNSTFLPVNIKSLIYKNESYNLLSCNGDVSCRFESPKFNEICPKEPETTDFGRTFWMYLGIRLVVTLGIGLVNGLFDAASMTIIQRFKADVGYQRFWATISMCIFAPISGQLADTFDGDFKPCFFLYLSLYTIAAVTSLFLDLSMKLPSENAFSNLYGLLGNPEVGLMLLHVGILGICWGFLENYLFLFLENDLQATKLLMGLTVTVGSGTGLFMALVSTWCTRKLGYVNVMVLAFGAYTIRYIGYSIARNAYVCLIFEMMENFTVTLLTVGVTLYCTELATMKMLTTMMTLWNGLHVISGRAFGSLLGGFLVARLGYVRTFRVFACISTVFGLFYIFMNMCWLKQWKKKTKRYSIDSDRKDTLRSEESGLSQALITTGMHCSFDSPALIAYHPEVSEIDVRRRAVSHTPRTTSNSFRGIGVQSRQAKSFSGTSRGHNNLATVMELEGETVDETRTVHNNEVTKVPTTRF